MLIIGEGWFWVSKDVDVGDLIGLEPKLYCELRNVTKTMWSWNCCKILRKCQLSISYETCSGKTNKSDWHSFIFPAQIFPSLSLFLYVRER